MINTEALAYMRSRSLAGWVIRLLAEHDDKRFADRAAWLAHLHRLGITALDVTPDPVRIATEGALWGSVKAHGLIRGDYRGTARYAHLASDPVKAAAAAVANKIAAAMGGGSGEAGKDGAMVLPLRPGA